MQKSDVIQYSEGDGNDVVVNRSISSYDSKINFAIDKGSYTVDKDGKDLLVKVGSGSIRFINMADKYIDLIINGTSVEIATSETATSTTTTPSTTSTSTPTVEPVATTTSTTQTTTSTSTPTVSSGGDTNIYNAPVTINNNTTINSTDISETNVNNTNVNETNNTNVSNTNVNETNNTNISNTYTYTYNGGNKTIKNYQVGEVIALTSDYQGIGLEGNSFFVKSSSGAVEIQNARDKFIGYSAGDDEVLVYSYVASGSGAIDGRGKNQVELMIGADNADNQIYAGSGGSSLWGGNGGNDTLTGGSGYDEFFYAIGSGSDLIKNAASNDVINLLGISLDQITYADIGDSAVNVGFVDGGKLKVEGGSGVGYKVGNTTYTVNPFTKQWREK